MKSVQPITTRLQIAGVIGRTRRKTVLPSRLCHWPSMQQHGSRATNVSPAASRRALSCRNTQSPVHAYGLATRQSHGMQSQASYSTSATTSKEPTVHDVFETFTSTWQYIVADPSTKAAVIIDPVLDYDPATQAITTHSADGLLSLAEREGYKIEKILETHAHADHLTAASYLQSRFAQRHGFKPPIGIGKRIVQVQKLFSKRYDLAEDEWKYVFDTLFEDDETFSIGELTAKAIHLPGHTPDHLGYQIGENVFCGDTVFHADIGTARCDFPGGDASNLFHSGRRLLALGDNVKIRPGHDYPPEGRAEPFSSMSVHDHKKQNLHLREDISEDEFVSMRTQRDKTLSQPRLLHPSLQMNIRAGRLPRPTATGQRMLHLPLKLNGLEW